MISVNAVEVEVKNFPGGEIYIERVQEAFSRVLETANIAYVNTVYWRWEGDHELLWLRFVKRHLDSLGAVSQLVIAYMPYARMDRATNYLFTLPEVADVINELGFIKVVVIEPHSDVATALLKNSAGESPTSTWMLKAVKAEIEFNPEVDFLAFPDAGAQKRYGGLRGYREVVGLKHRSAETGELGDYHLVGAAEIGVGAKVLICDDLCSYGGTLAAMSAAIVKEAPGALVYLMVTHLEPTVYRGSMLDGSPILRVFATNTLQNTAKHAKVALFDIASRKIIQNEEE